MNRLAIFESNFSKPPGEIVFIKEIQGVKIYLQKEYENHPFISGNKLRKLYLPLKNYLEIAPEHPCILSFGGAFSNHLLAVAEAAHLLSIPSIGIVRGEELEELPPEELSPTLKHCQNRGMALRFVSRSFYREKKLDAEYWQHLYPNALIIPEGGTSLEGLYGVRGMLPESENCFDYICTPVGSGGTMAGLVKYSSAPERILGFMAVKDKTLPERISTLTDRAGIENQLIDAAGRGFGKFGKSELDYMSDFYRQHNIWLDSVYTAKMLMKMENLIHSGYFATGSKILAIHTGGLQGIPPHMTTTSNITCI